MESELYDLTHPQNRIFMQSNLRPEGNWDLVVFLVKFKSEIDFKILSKAINQVIKEHDALRTVLVKDKDSDKVKQRFNEFFESDLDIIDFSIKTSEEYKKWNKVQFFSSYSIYSEKLYDFTLVKFPDGEQGYLMRSNHVCSDGTTCYIIFNRINEAYKSITSGVSNDVQIRSYKDFIEFEKEYVDSTKYKSDRSFWDSENLSELDELVISTKKTNNKIGETKVYVKDISEELFRIMDKFRIDNKISIYKQILSALSVYIHRISGLDSFGFSFCGHNRSKEFLQTAGMFVGTYPIRIDVVGDMNLFDIQKNISGKLNIIVKEHGLFPYEDIIKLYREKDKTDISHLMNITLIELFYPLSNDFDAENPILKDVQNHLTIYINNYEDPNKKNSLRFLFDSNVFSPLDIQNIADGIINILQSFFQDQTKKVRSLSLISQTEYEKQIVKFNDTSKPFPEDKCVHQLFEEAAKKFADKTALEFEDKSISYKELNDKADILARDLIEAGVGAEKTVAVYMHKSIENVIALIAVLKAGSAYVPIDPHLPIERANFMINDANCKYVISDDDLHKNILNKENLCSIIYNNSEKEIIIDDKFIKTERTNSNPNSLMYIIYTSGSTGEPKGVMVEHKGFVNLVHYQLERYKSESSHRFLHFLSFGFDASQDHLFRNLCAGNTLHLIDLNDKSKKNDIRSVLKDQKITSCAFPASMLEALDENDYPDLKVISVGADKCTLGILEKWSKGRQFYNSYGPTETTVIAACTQLDAKSNSVHIGKPLSNMSTYVLDRYLMPLPLGCIGELHIGGIGVARGYINNDELTNEKFIQNPFINDSGSKIYKSGDLVSYRADGNINFIGRKDNQVKIRGYRIELEDIESALMKNKKINEIKVVVLGSEKIKQIAACYVSVDHEDIKYSEMKRKLKQLLPLYMIPDKIVRVDKIPRTLNGKVDTEKIIHNIENIYRNDHTKETLNKTERKLKRLWCDLLKIDNISIKENFFFSGGDSLMVLELLTLIKKKFEVDITTDQFMESSTIEQIAGIIDKRSDNSESIEPINIVDDPDGSILYMHGFGGYSNYGQLLAKEMDVNFDQYSTRIDMRSIKNFNIQNLDDLLTYYVNILLEKKVKFPLLIIGYSWGGIPAYEISVKFTNQGKSVELLLIDTKYPGKKKHTFMEKISRASYHIIRSRIFLQSFLSIRVRRIFANNKSDYNNLWKQIKLEFKKYFHHYFEKFPELINRPMKKNPNFKTELALTLVTLDYELSKSPEDMRINYIVTPFRQVMDRKYFKPRNIQWERNTSGNFNSIYVDTTHNSLIESNIDKTIKHIEDITDKMINKN